jgi:hypothetical protein
MDRYNKLKRQTLSVFADADWLRPIDVAERLRFFPRRSAWSYLKRLWGFGLLDRRSTLGWPACAGCARNDIDLA